MNRTCIHNRIWSSRLALLSVVVLAACDSPLPPENQSEPLPVLARAIVSNPMVPSANASAAGGLAFSGAAAPEVAWVSLPPLTLIDADQATLRNSRTGSEVTVAIVHGGFDPVAVNAAVGDTLQLDVHITGTDVVLSYAMLVPPAVPPSIVRTDPPPKKRDVPLNAAMLVVFSEPIAPKTVTPQSVLLLTAAGDTVPGSVTLATDGLRAEFQPYQWLTPNTDYELVVRTDVTDLTGDPLTQALTVEFTAQQTCGGASDSTPVVTVSVTADCSVPGTVPTVAEGVRLVQPGGVVQFVTNTTIPFTIDSINVTKPITFRSADAGSPVIEVRAPSVGFTVMAVPSGTVTFSGLTFVTEGDNWDPYSAVYAQGTYDQVVVENSTFLVGGATGVFGGSSSVPGARVTVRNNRFSFPPVSSSASPDSVGSFGALAVFGAGAGAMLDVSDNLVEGPTAWGAIQFQSGASGQIENNTATQCGSAGCIRVVGGASSSSGPGVIIVGNTVSSAPGLGTRAGIRVGLDGSVVTGNVVNGGFSGGDPTDPASYGYSAGGIQINGTNMTVTGNTISGAVLGFEGNASPQAAHVLQDNVITRVITAFSGTFGTTTLTKNDITDYVIPFTLTFGSGALICNWWGSASGPVLVPAGASASIYSPWATAPIARNAGGACNGT